MNHEPDHLLRHLREVGHLVHAGFFSSIAIVRVVLFRHPLLLCCVKHTLAAMRRAGHSPSERTYAIMIALCARRGPFGFFGRVGSAIEDLVGGLLDKNDDAAAPPLDFGRVVIGVRAWRAPLLLPTAVRGFGADRAAFVRAVLCSTTLPASCSRSLAST